MLWCSHHLLQQAHQVQQALSSWFETHFGYIFALQVSIVAQKIALIESQSISVLCPTNMPRV